MRQNYLALSMGLINPEIPNQNLPSQVDIYSNILRDIAQSCIDSGVKVYLPFSVEHINSLDQVYNLICHSGYCVMALDDEGQRDDIIDKAMAIVRGYAESFVSNIESLERGQYIQDFVKSFKPYAISLHLDKVNTTADVFDSILSNLNDVVNRGRNLSMDTKASVCEMLGELKLSRSVG